MFLMYTSRVNCWSKYISWSVSDNLTISSTRKVKQGCGLYMHTIEIMPGHKKILYGKVKIQGPKNKRIITVGDCLGVGNLETVANLFPSWKVLQASKILFLLFCLIFVLYLSFSASIFLSLCYFVFSSGIRETSKTQPWIIPTVHLPRELSW